MENVYFLGHGLRILHICCRSKSEIYRIVIWNQNRIFQYFLAQIPLLEFSQYTV